jgi:hypothetical protein
VRRKRLKPPAVDHTTQLLLNALNLGSRLDRPTKRARSQPPTLYAFPSYDKSDSLLYFPVSLVRHANSGDYAGLSRLLTTSVDKNCEVMCKCYHGPGAMPARCLANVFQLMNEMHPDTIMCVHGTQVEGNTITAAIYAKFTYCHAITDALRHAHSSYNHDLPEPVSYSMLQTSQHHCRDQLQHESMLNDAQRGAIHQMVRDRATMLMYVKVVLTVVCDEMTRKIVSVKFDQHITSAEKVDDL